MRVDTPWPAVPVRPGRAARWSFRTLRQEESVDGVPFFFRQDIVGYVPAGFVYGHHHASVSGMPRMSLTSGARSSTGRLDNTP